MMSIEAPRSARLYRYMGLFFSAASYDKRSIGNMTWLEWKQPVLTVRRTIISVRGQ
jgi:hypothetical protein